MVDVVHRPATHADADALADSMREADRAEVVAMGLDVRAAAHHSIEASIEAFATDFDGSLACMWGVSPGKAFLGGGTLGGPVVGWLLTTTVVDAHPRAFWRESKHVAAALLQRWGTLANLVDVRHTRALSWLAGLGGVFGAEVQFGAAPFRCVTLRRR